MRPRKNPLHHHESLAHQLLWILLIGGGALLVVWFSIHFRHLDRIWTDNILIRLIQQAHQNAGGVK